MKNKAYFIKIYGTVQSVGFRPTIYRLFKEYSGWVKNELSGVSIYLESNLNRDEIVDIIKKNAPKNSRIEKIIIDEYSIKKRVFDTFTIKETSKSTKGLSLIPPDLGICDECLNEMFDENNRRFLHPFINCTDCGPRFSIITGSPYDRNKTTMKNFQMCNKCRIEYENPSDRRFHAQPIACNSCGPDYFLIKEKRVLKKGLDAIRSASVMLKSGKVGLVKGVGGYHLICDALNDSAVLKIKELKHRYEKPFAVISKDLSTIERYCFTNKKEKELLLSQAKPIVLLKSRDCKSLKNIKNNSPYIGVMLPYAPIHHLIFYFSDMELLVATSANFTEKPLIYNDADAIDFKGVDFTLANNRRIVRPLEDSIVQVVDDKVLNYRYARGFAPGVFLRKTKQNILALGGDLKNNIAIALKDKVIVSQYTGDLKEFENNLRFEVKVKDFLNFFSFKPDIVVCDKHPEYFSSNYAFENFDNVVSIQHHIAHFESVIFEHRINDDAIGVIMDGTGFGDDGNIWGGEFFVKKEKVVKRVGHIEYMPFAFGDKAVKEPYRLAILWLLSLGIKEHILFERYKKITQVAKNIKHLNTSSAGRLFDVVSAMLGIKEISSYEAQSAIELTYAALGVKTNKRFEYSIKGFNINFKPTLEQIATLKNIDKNTHAATFHNTFINAVIKNVKNIAKETAIKNIVLSGGVFQNEIILKGIVKRLIDNGFNVYFNEKIPINDGGLALGQLSSIMG